MKVFVLRANEDWIIDRMSHEFETLSGCQTTNNPFNADVIWLLADFCWQQLPQQLLQNKKVVTTIHHIVPEKFGQNEQLDFKRRDEITDVYHVFNDRTATFIRQYTNKPIVFLPYWINLDFWKRLDHIHQEYRYYEIRSDLQLPIDKFLIGSFQRDTEGSGIDKGIFLPKLEKGADIFCDAVEVISTKRLADPDIAKCPHVLLGGWRRQYVMQRLNAVNIIYHYHERPSLETIRDMYVTTDLYIVGSRCEGGPQAILEAAAMGTPIISTPVGIAEQVLHPTSINSKLECAHVDGDCVEYAYQNIIEKFDCKKVFPRYVKFFEGI